MLLALSLGLTALANPREHARAALEAYVSADQLPALVSALDAAAAETRLALAAVGPSGGAGDRLYLAVARNLAEKQAAGLPMDADEIRRTVIGYEAFKLSAYVNSGVFPKRYFGYLDGKGDTAAYEARLQRATRASVAVLNAWQAEQGRPVRVSEAEVAVTFLAEGGAWFLGERQDLLAGLHPVFDVGLDNVASGLNDLPVLRDRLDRAVGTDLRGLVALVERDAVALPVPSSVPNDLRWLQHGNGDAGPYPYLTRLMSFEEAVAGTALMVLWEKEIAAEKMEREGWAPMMSRPLDEQFIITSLVYNSGLVFTPDRWAQIRDFATGAYLFERSEANAGTRERLNLLAPGALLAEILPFGEYRDQFTSWSAVYHVLQRYGAYVALQRYGELFDGQDAFRVMLEAPPETAAPPPPGDVALAPRSPRGWLALVALALAVWRIGARRRKRSAIEAIHAPIL